MKTKMQAELSAIPAMRSAWNRGIMVYAVELVDSLDEAADLSNERLLMKAMLNGAESWQQYSKGGCSLICDKDIAKRLCSPSGLKRVRGGERQPNARENWIECQARALGQAAIIVRDAYSRVNG